MPLVILVVLLALILGGAGFLLHALWIIAIVVLVLWLVGFLVGGGQGAWYGNKRGGS